MLWAAQSYAFDGPEHSFGEAALILSETGSKRVDYLEAASSCLRNLGV